MDRQMGLEERHDCGGWATDKRILELRDDLTDAEVVYVYNELKKCGLL